MGPDVRPGALSSGAPGSPPPAIPGGVPHLYVHIPFCERICPYCDFSVVVGSGSDTRRFLDALQREGERYVEAGLLACVDTLFIGGGTPSWLGVGDLERLMGMLHGWTGGGWAEATLEMNPEHATADRMEVLASSGITRLSLGVQSLDAGVLRTLGRVHTPAQVSVAVAAARGTALDVSLDLIFAVPGQSMEVWERDLEEALLLGPDHLSLYDLTYEEGTPFHRWLGTGRLTPHEEAWEAEAYARAVALLADAGLERYEVSNFARPGKESAHNRAYWSEADYLGLGPGAHSLLGRLRAANAFRMSDWQARIEAGAAAWTSTEELDDLARSRERVMLGLRTREGLDLDQVAEPYREGVRERAAALDREGLARVQDGGRVVLTDEGMRVADALAVRLAP